MVESIYGIGNLRNKQLLLIVSARGNESLQNNLPKHWLYELWCKKVHTKEILLTDLYSKN